MELQKLQGSLVDAEEVVETWKNAIAHAMQGDQDRDRKIIYWIASNDYKAVKDDSIRFMLENLLFNGYTMYKRISKTYSLIMSIKIAKWGNSLGIRIPKQIIEQSQLTEGMELDIKKEDNSLILTPRKKQYTLSELLEGMDENHLHSEIDWGEPVGKEQW